MAMGCSSSDPEPVLITPVAKAEFLIPSVSGFTTNLFFTAGGSYIDVSDGFIIGKTAQRNDGPEIDIGQSYGYTFLKPDVDSTLNDMQTITVRAYASGPNSYDTGITQISFRFYILNGWYYVEFFDDSEFEHRIFALYETQ